MDDLANFRSNVRLVIDRDGLSQDTLAAKSGISRVYLNRILKGGCDPSMTICGKIALGLGMPLRLLLEEPGRIFQKVS